MADKLKNPQTNELFCAILKLETIDECYDFFEDLCTVTEIQDMSQRFEVAGMLSEGRVYSDITAKTGASTATISRVNRALQYGKDGYKLVLKRTKNN